MTPAEIIARAIHEAVDQPGKVYSWHHTDFAQCRKSRDLARVAIEALAAAGYRIIGPGELDRETIEAAARIADRLSYRNTEDAFDYGYIRATDDIATAIRSLSDPAP